MKQRNILIAILTSVALIFTCAPNAMAIKTIKQKNVLKKYSDKNFKPLSNTKSFEVKTPKRIPSPKYTKPNLGYGHIEEDANQYNPTKQLRFTRQVKQPDTTVSIQEPDQTYTDSNTGSTLTVPGDWTTSIITGPTVTQTINTKLRTMIFLSSYLNNGKKQFSLTNPQSLTMVKEGSINYMYIVFAVGNNNKGRIVRYNLTKIEQLGLLEDSNLYKLRKAAADREGIRKVTNPFTTEQKQILTVMKIGPTINIGHGQGFAYNTKTKQLWLMKDDTKKNGVWKTTYKSYIQKINIKTLKPDLKIEYSTSLNKKKMPFVGHVLTFDNKGVGYFTTYSKQGFRIFKMTIGKSPKYKISIQMLQTIKHVTHPKRVQSISWNPKTNKLLLCSEDSLMTIPVSKLGKLKDTDIQYVKYNSHREFEGTYFDNQGYLYLLVNYGAELLKTGPFTF